MQVRIVWVILCIIYNMIMVCGQWRCGRLSLIIISKSEYFTAVHLVLSLSCHQQTQYPSLCLDQFTSYFLLLKGSTVVVTEILESCCAEEQTAQCNSVYVSVIWIFVNCGSINYVLCTNMFQKQTRKSFIGVEIQRILTGPFSNPYLQYLCILGYRRTGSTSPDPTHKRERVW